MITNVRPNKAVKRLDTRIVGLAEDKKEKGYSHVLIDTNTIDNIDTLDIRH